MNAERWLELDRIFAEARVLPPAARTEFVDRECRTDPELRRDVLSLLTADQASGDFLSRPALEKLAERFVTEGRRLRSGERLGSYTVLDRLGAGGVGEVWRARDERLARDVAIKVLLPHLSTDTERLRRFMDEARAAGSLNHPNILTVYDVGETNGLPYLVAECLEGRNLRSRLDAGTVAVDEATRIAIAVCHGLAAAHARGIVHRDLKPENVFLGGKGVVRILDFGLAKLLPSPDGMQGAANETVAGTIVGTTAYMSPEQLGGRPADARSDLYALGVMLYEMLTGQNPFRGASTFETLRAILTRDVPPLQDVNAQVPPQLARIVMRLVERDPESRFQSAADLAWALELVASRARSGAEPGAPAGRKRVGWPAVVAAAALILGAAGGAWLAAGTSSPSNGLQLTQFTWTLPDGVTLDSPPLVSPDGRRIAFAGADESGTRLWLRELASLDFQPIPGSEGAVQPFWSPDGQSLGFFAGRQLKTVSLPAGVPVAVAEALQARGGAWSIGGDILFSPDLVLSGLSRLGADGSVVKATQLDTSLGDTGHWWPQFLPDGAHYLYYQRSLDDTRRGLYVGRLGRLPGNADTPLIRSDSGAVFVALPGETQGILFHPDHGRLAVRRFDLQTLSVVGDVRTIGFAAAEGTLYRPPMIGASADVLAFASETVPTGNRLEVVTRNGERLRTWDNPEAQNWPRVSPDGTQLARQRVGNPRNSADIWVDDLGRGTQLRITNSIEPDIQPVWALDGRHLAFVTGYLPMRDGPVRMLSIAAADGTGIMRSIPCPGDYCEPTDWSPDGTNLLVNVLDRRNVDIWSVPLDAGTARPLLAGAAAERDARYSPDGRWIAYVAEESGRPEVSVRTVSGPPRRIVVSADGGTQPVWRRDGRELFFVDPHGNLRSTPVDWRDSGMPEFGLPVKLGVPPVGSGHWGTQYDVSPDGNEIYLLRRNDDPPPREIHIVIGWQALLE